jgi:myosin V
MSTLKTRKRILIVSESTNFDTTEPVWIKAAIVREKLGPVSNSDYDNDCHSLNRTKANARRKKQNLDRMQKVEEWGWLFGYVVQKSDFGRNVSPTSEMSTSNVYSSSKTESKSNPFGNVTLRKTLGSVMEKELNSQQNVSKIYQPKSILIQDSWNPQYNGCTVDLSEKEVESCIVQANSFQSDSDAAPKNLIELTHLHEPSLIQSLKSRYDDGNVYTYCGKILLALNPFRSIEGLYSEEMMKQYWNIDPGVNDETSIQPHAYAIARDAYVSMMRSFECTQHGAQKGQDDIKIDQSILVSGESGAGKTVTTKIVMQCLAKISEHCHANNREIFENFSNECKTNTMEQQVLQSNPILESFGNARTVRNDNSSRFGKFIEIQFHRSGRLEGASILTYLLEKVRLIQQGENERNYHIFYELLSGLEPCDAIRRKLCLQGYGIHDFRITAMSGTFDRRDGVNDSESFASLQKAMDTVGFSVEERIQIFKAISGLLHMSNVRFMETSTDEVALNDQSMSLRHVLNIFGVNETTLSNAVCKSTITVGGEVLQKNLCLNKAQKAIEALMKATYGALFELIVRKINSSITIGSVSGDHKASSNHAGAEHHAFIKILDIFGFESFDSNSFEQLCINYCNESLQQQFNKHVFKLEQEEYEREGIEWSFISFPDNQDILDLIETKHSGLFSILDEQCKLAKCTDQSFANATYEKCAGSPRFVYSATQQARGRFSILHYAGEVEYSCESFLDKNKDELPKEATDFLQSSAERIFHDIATLLNDRREATRFDSSPIGLSGKRASNSLTKASVGSQFSSQLKNLRENIDLTTPHYIRCLKPNHQLIANYFEPSIVADQLRCAGVLDAIRVSRIGYPQRYKKDIFFKRYHFLKSKELLAGKETVDQNQCDALVHDIVSQLQKLNYTNSSSDSVPFGVQLGTTKVFLRHATFEHLEHLRTRKLHNSATQIQTSYRKFSIRRAYLRKIEAIVEIQSYIRRYKAASRAELIKQNIKASIIQSVWRRFSAYSIYSSKIYTILWCQRAYRANKAREKVKIMVRERKIVIIQSWWRMSRCRGEYLIQQYLAFNLQQCFRAKQARCVLKRLQIEAKQFAHVASERDLLVAKNVQMRKEIEELKTINTACNCRVAEDAKNEHDQSSELEQIKRVLKEKMHLCESQQMEISYLRKKIEELSEELSRLFSNERGSPSSVASESIVTRRLDHSELMKLANTTLQTESTYLEESFGSYQSRSAFPYQCDTPIHSAIRAADDDALSIAITNCEDVAADINKGGEGGMTPLHLAIINSNLTLAKLLLENESVANTQDDSGNTPLHYASSVDSVQLLLEIGKANPNIPNNVGFCALHVAAQKRDYESVKALLHHSAKVNVADNVKWLTPLHLIAQETAFDADQSSGEEVLEIARILCMRTGADLNYQDRGGNTPLHHAAVLSHQYAGELINILLKKGANPNVTNSRGQTPVHLLLHNLRLRRFAFFSDLVQFMLFNGFDTNLQSLNGCSSLHLAIYHQDFDNAVQLLEREAQLHLSWQKPTRWASHWNDNGSTQVYCMDMVSDPEIMYQLFSSISTEQTLAPSRSTCMQCKKRIGAFGKKNCRHCGCLICLTCGPNKLDSGFFPPYCQKVIQSGEPMRVCNICEEILVSRKNDSDGVLGREVYIPTNRREEISMLDYETSFNGDSHVYSLLK